MCNLYSLTKGQAAIRELARAMRDTTGNLPPLPGILPDQMAPVVRNGRDGEREVAMLRWGFPPVAKPGARPFTNMRNGRLRRGAADRRAQVAEIDRRQRLDAAPRRADRRHAEP